jgi:hypothetical protein
MPRKQAIEKDIVVSTPVPARRKSVSPRAKRSVTAAAATPEKSTVPETQSAQSSPTRDDIALLAYSYWEARGCQGGCPEEDWFRAEQELTAPQQRAATALA